MRILLAAAGVLACAPAMALAAPNPFAASTASVRVADLDLNSPSGQRQLDQRLALAADAVCGKSVTHIHLAMSKKAAQCRAEVIADARQQIGAGDTLQLRGTD